MTGDEARDLQEGEAIGPFRVVRALGRGGFGAVFLARDQRLGRWVALKVITRPTWGGLVEARAAAQLSHPNIVTVYDVGEHDGRPYVALEYVPGDTLRERLDRERPPLAEALRMARDLAGAVAAAHAAGVAHLDLSARNVIVGNDGRLRVVDFGLARLHGEPASERVAAGTPAYMAPEQWQDQDVGPAADVWALGVILHELLLGCRPLERLPPSQLRQRVCEPAPLPLGHADAGTPPSDVAALPVTLAELLAACLDKQPARRPAAEVVAERLAQATAEVGPTGSPGAPFRGLVPLDESHAAGFAGRDDDLAALRERLRGEATVCVVGPSGAGKSSLLRAGLAPRLRASGWTVLTLRPGATPLRALADAVTGRGVDAAAVGSTVDLDGGLAESDPGAGALAERWRRTPGLVGMDLADVAATSGAPLALVIDPLEEVETLTAVEDRDAVLDALARIGEDSRGKVRVLFGVRDDFLGRLAARLGAGASLGHVHVLATPGPPALRAVLERPLAAIGYRFDDGIVDDMLQAVRGEAAALSLVQVAGAAMWERRDEARRCLPRAAYDEIGGVAGALAGHADRALAACTPAQLEAARVLLLRLVAADGTRRPRPRRELLDGLAAEAAPALDRLVAARLVTARRGSGRAGDEVELAHELLVTRWRALSGWLDETRGQRVVLDELTVAAMKWHERGRPGHGLWRGDPLGEARRTLERAAASARPVAHEFVAAAVARERRGRWQRRALVATIVVALSAIGVVFAGQRREARQQALLASSREASALVEAAWSALAEQRMVEARGLLRAAAEIEVTPEVRALDWRLGLEARRWRATLPTPVEGIAWLAGGDGLAAVGLDTAVRVLDAATGQVRVLGNHDDMVLSVAAAPLAAEIVTGGEDNAVLVWPGAGGAPRRLGRHAAPVIAVSYSPDGRWIAAGDGAGEIVVRAAADGAEAWRARAGDAVYDLAWSGERLAVITAGGQALLVDAAGAARALPVEDAASLAADEAGALAVGTDDGRVVLVHPDGTLERELRAHAARVTTVEIAGPLLVSAGLDGVARVRERATGRVVAEAELGGLPVAAAYLDRQRHRLALVGTTSVEVVSIDGPRLPGDSGFPGTVIDVAYSSDGRFLIAGGEGGLVRSFEVASGRLVATRATGHGSVRALASDGDDLYTAGQDGRVRRWHGAELTGGELVGEHSAPVVDLAIAPGGAVVSGSYDRTVRVWRAAGARVLDAGAPVMAVAVAPVAGRIVGLTDNRRVLSWRLDGEGAGELLLRVPDNSVEVTALSDGRSVALIGESPQLVIDLVSGRRRTFASPVRLWAAWPAPADARLVVVGAGGYGAVVDLDRGTSVLLGEHRWSFLDTHFGPDGLTVATAGEDGLAGLWRADDGRFAWGERALAAPLDGLADRPGSLRANPTVALELGGLRFVGHTDGLVTATTRERTAAAARLHGAVTGLVRDGDDVIARSVTGGEARFPIGGVDVSACVLLRRLWQDVPALWRAGKLVVSPPPTAHRCLR